MTPAEFFAPTENLGTPYHKLCEKLHDLTDEELDKVSTFVDWIEK